MAPNKGSNTSKHQRKHVYQQRDEETSLSRDSNGAPVQSSIEDNLYNHHHHHQHKPGSKNNHNLVGDSSGTPVGKVIVLN